ncbi:hypothetical protein Tco_0267701 [Tanacetum coccineum]
MKQDGHGATVGAKVSVEAMNDADMSAVEDPPDATIDGEHMDAVGHPDENEGPNAKEPISHVLITPVDNGDVLMTDAHDTINLADPPSHESEITSPCSSEKKGDGLDGVKANQVLTYQKKKVVRKPKRETSRCPSITEDHNGRR